MTTHAVNNVAVKMQLGDFGGNKKSPEIITCLMIMTRKLIICIAICVGNTGLPRTLIVLLDEICQCSTLMHHQGK